jgi:hypothetical protein
MDTTPSGGSLLALARVSALAAKVARRTRLWGWLALAAAPAIWAIFLGRWVFDSWSAFAAWLPLAVALAVPGIVLLGFAGRVRRLSALPERLPAEVGVVVDDARRRVADELAQGDRSGLGRLRALVASLREIRRRSDRSREIVGEAAGTLRLVNPFYLLVVLASSFVAGLLVAMLAVALVLLAF